MKSLEHIKLLSESIGPRGSGTMGEELAHAYCRETLSILGLEPREEQFFSTASAYRPFILASVLMLVSYYLFNKTSIQVPAMIVAAIATVSAFLELLFLPNPMRWILPKKQSQNVYAISPAQNTPKQKIVLVAHVDSHRTPLIWREAIFTAQRLY